MTIEVNADKLSTFKKYSLYESSVQCHDADIEFINQEFQEIYKKRPLTLKEDFCGTGLLACEWVRQGEEHRSWAVDLDFEPINYGKEKHFSRLLPDEKKRITYIQGDVREDYGRKVDVIVAFNFSYFIFKKRKELLEYFKNVRQQMNKDGAFFVDLFGGIDSVQEILEETEYDNFSYFWDCDKFNPITHECNYAIHFKLNDENVRYNNVFTYDWRLWGMAELREILEDSGFRKVISYWEEDDGDGGGNGNFYRTETCENCESWVTYLMALP